METKTDAGKTAPKIDAEQEKKEILRRYRALLRASTRSKSDRDKKLIRRALDVAVHAHRDMRRRSGEPYIYHPIEVAQIVASEIGLGTTSIVCALLHDTVEDTEITLDDIERQFGETVRRVIDGLTKISGVFDQSSSLQAENFRKMLLTLSDDVRVILIKVADRLHNMRTLGSMPHHSQQKIASETQFLYAPLAHRLGLYSIKTELEDLALKYKDPKVYEDITTKLKKTQAVRTRFINQFSLPIKRELNKHGLKFEVKGRTKSIYSIFDKMNKKGIDFAEVYDVFAIRIIIDSSLEKEKADCWEAYSVVTDFYQPNPDRLRDWVSTPRANGYESLHTTVMSPTGKWVEVQIRSRRMDEIAEKGYAAHWKYKGANNSETGFDSWLTRVRELLESPESDAMNFVDDFKLNLFSDEIFVFTPTGELITLPFGSTSLDFAFEIHSQVGRQCIGAKVNQKLAPLSHKLRSGDQVEIITSKKQEPKKDWLKMVITAKALSSIKSFLKEEKKRIALEGKEMVQRKFKSLKVDFNSDNIGALGEHYGVADGTDLYFRIAKGNIQLKKLQNFKVNKGVLSFPKSNKNRMPNIEQLVTNVPSKGTELIIGDSPDFIKYKLSPCCNPIPGDDVFGFVTINDGVKIHRANCPNAVQLLANFAYRVVKARWTSQELIEVLTGIRFEGIDNIGVVNSITTIISNELTVNMRSISFESQDGIFEGMVTVYVHDTDHLDQLINKLKEVDGVRKVQRIIDPIKE